MNSYDLSRKWFDFCYNNPNIIKPNHIAIYFFAIEHCNRLGWKDKFGFPTTMAMEAIGIRSYNTYIKALNEIVNWGFIEMIERSKNQYSSNIIALSIYDKANSKALDKAFIKHRSKQHESNSESIDSIDKPINNKPKNQLTIEERKDGFKKSLSPFLEKYTKDFLNEFYGYWTEHNEGGKKMRFEYTKNQPFNITRRLTTFYKKKQEWEKEKKRESKPARHNIREGEHETTL